MESDFINNHVTMSATQFLPFIFLSIALMSLWLRAHRNNSLRYAWLIALALACITALYLEQLQAVAILIVILSGVLAWYAGNTNVQTGWRWVAGSLFIVVALALGMHLMPGFHSLPVMQDVVLSPGAMPYSLYFNIDKTLIALFILGFWYQRPASVLSWPTTGYTLFWLFPLVIGSVIALALLLNYIQFEPKIIDGLGLWMWANLFFTCIAEEAFFRGLFQQQLSRRLLNIPAGNWIAIVIVSVIFGLAHLGGGGVYVLLYTVAGFGYGAVYYLTGRIEASILLHFALNLTHIMLFTYPALMIS